MRAIEWKRNNFTPAGALLKVSAALIIVLVRPDVADASTSAFIPGDTGGKQETGRGMDRVSNLSLKARLALFNAQEKNDEGKHAEAAEILYEFLSKNRNDDNCMARYHLAMSYAQAGEPEKSLDHFQKCVEFDSTFAPAWMKLGETAFNLGSYNIASGAFLRGYELDERKTPDLLYYAATACYLSDDPGGALEILDRLMSGPASQPRLEWFRTYLAACNSAGDDERGRRAAERMAEEFPSNAEAWLLACQYFASVRDYRGAAACMTIVDYLRPLSDREARTLGDLFTAAGVPSRAAVFYEGAFADTSGAEDCERLASAYLASYDFGSARKTLEKAIARDATPRLWSLLGDMHLLEQSYEDAYFAYEKSSAMDGSRGRPELMMGYCSFELGRIADAERHLERAAGFEDSGKVASDFLAKIRSMKR